MTLVCMASTRGAPGATTLAALLAWAWPGEAHRYVLEADPAGGVLAARWHEAAGLTWEPGILELSASRQVIDAEALTLHAQPLGHGVSVAPARPVGVQVEAALSNLGARGAEALTDPSCGVVIADLGRIVVATSTLPLARASTLTCLVFRPQLEQVQTVLNTVSHLQAEGVEVGLVSIGGRPYRPAEVAERAGVEFVAEIPDDPRSARSFAQQGLAWRGLKRSPLGRATRAVAAELAARCDSPALSATARASS